MSRLIDADAITNSRELATKIFSHNLTPYIKTEDLIAFIDNLPAIEADPVVHGEWKYENYTWHCGVCGFHPFKGYIPKTPNFNFCPNCGAKMKGGAE